MVYSKLTSEIRIVLEYLHTRLSDEWIAELVGFNTTIRDIDINQISVELTKGLNTGRLEYLCNDDSITLNIVIRELRVPVTDVKNLPLIIEEFITNFDEVYQ